MSNFPHSMLAPNLKTDDALQLILKNSAELKSSPKKTEGTIYWGAEHYGLDKSKLFSTLKTERSEAVLQNLNQSSLGLSYFIEKFGLNYGAKMILLSDSTEEKSLYSLFSADEVRHRLWIESFMVGDLPTSIDFHPLLPALNTALSHSDKEAMVFSLQVVLEGFGLSYYASLRESCLSPDLKAVFTDILKDEALHHGMGVQLTQRMNLSDSSKEQISELTALFVRALLDADLIIQSVEKEIGGFSNTQKKELLSDLDWQKRMHDRVTRLKNLLSKVGYHGLSENLEAKGVFKIA